MKDLSNDRFSRIVIRTDDPPTAYFVNDEQQLYSAKIDSLKTELEALYADSDFYEVESYRGKNKTILCPNKIIWMWNSLPI